jgi:hypothetical protein
MKKEFHPLVNLCNVVLCVLLLVFWLFLTFSGLDFWIFIVLFLFLFLFNTFNLDPLLCARGKSNGFVCDCVCVSVCVCVSMRGNAVMSMIVIKLLLLTAPIFSCLIVSV